MRCTLFDNHKCGGIYLTVKSENMKESFEIFLSQKLDNCLHGLMNIMNMDTCKHAGKKSFLHKVQFTHNKCLKGITMEMNTNKVCPNLHVAKCFCLRTILLQFAYGF